MTEVGEAGPDAAPDSGDSLIEPIEPLAEPEINTTELAIEPVLETTEPLTEPSFDHTALAELMGEASEGLADPETDTASDQNPTTDEAELPAPEAIDGV